MTHRRTSLVYTVDLVRGMDVYNVALPGDDRIAQPVQLGAGNPFTLMSWPDGAPVLLVLAALVGSAALRRRVHTQA
jgi:MYXO-CTERM domain-containing protein